MYKNKVTWCLTVLTIPTIPELNMKDLNEDRFKALVHSCLLQAGHHSNTLKEKDVKLIILKSYCFSGTYSIGVLLSILFEQLNIKFNRIKRCQYKNLFLS